MKPTGEYRLVQDLRLVSEVVLLLHPIAANPYNLLSQIPDDAQWYSVSDLKDAFFCIPLHPGSQYLFAFEWTDPLKKMTMTMIHQQCTWTEWPQGFRDSPHLFARVLGKDLRELQLRGGALL